MATVDLWPDEIATDGGIEGPVVVLKEQAALLGKKTKNLVEAYVEGDTDQIDPSYFTDHFILTSSVINYRYELFVVRYSFGFYPASIWWNGYSNGVLTDGKAEWSEKFKEHINSRQELEEELKTIFSHPKTVRIIQAIIARARE